MKNYAFTLAEVLITLGIIGIVAAMTMPAIVAKYQRHVLLNQAKKVYSVLNNAFRSTEYDVGISGCCGDSIATNEEIAATFLSKLNIVKKYENVPLVQNGIIPAYKGLDAALQNPDEELLNWTKKYYLVSEDDKDWTMSNFYLRNMGGFCGSLSSLKYAYYLNDGSIIIEYPYGFRTIRLFLVDINGKKGPNKWGYDLIMFQAGKSIFNYGPVSEKGGIVSALFNFPLR